MSQNIVILDIDGVVASAKSLLVQGYSPTNTKGWDRATCGLIQKLCDHLQAKLVISSTWALAGKNSMRAWLNDVGITAPFHEDWITPRKMDGTSRSHEVNEWLDNHLELAQYSKIVILDDAPVRVQAKIGQLYPPLVIQCDSREGLLMRQYQEILIHFGIKPEIILM